MEGDETRQFVQIAISTEPNALEVLGALFEHPESVHGDEHPHSSSTRVVQSPHRFRQASAGRVAERETACSTLRPCAVEPRRWAAINVVDSWSHGFLEWHPSDLCLGSPQQAPASTIVAAICMVSCRCKFVACRGTYRNDRRGEGWRVMCVDQLDGRLQREPVLVRACVRLFLMCRLRDARDTCRTAAGRICTHHCIYCRDRCGQQIA